MHFLSSFEYDPSGLADERTSPRQPIKVNPHRQLVLPPITYMRTERNAVEYLIFCRSIIIIVSSLCYICLLKMYCILEMKLIILLIAYIYYIAKLKTVNLKPNAHTVIRYVTCCLPVGGLRLIVFLIYETYYFTNQT